MKPQGKEMKERGKKKEKRKKWRETFLARFKPVAVSLFFSVFFSLLPGLLHLSAFYRQHNAYSTPLCLFRGKRGM
jgi:hypothetical protein